MGEENNERSEKTETGCRGDCFRITFLIIRLISGFTGIGFSLAVVVNCSFIDYTLRQGQVNSGVFGINATAAAVGLFKFEPDDEGCRDIPEDKLGTDYTVARAGSVLAPAIAILALLILWVEFLCCRFKGSRCLLSTLFFIALIAQSLTFLIFTSDVCDLRQNRKTFPCGLASGAIQSMVACGFYFLSALLACVAAKPEPICKRLQESEESDPCLCPLRGRKSIEEEKEPEEDQDDLERADEMSEPQSAEPDHISVQDISTVSYDPSEMSHFSMATSPQGYGGEVLPPYSTAEVLEGDLFFDSELDE